MTSKKWYRWHITECLGNGWGHQAELFCFGNISSFCDDIIDTEQVRQWKNFSCAPVACGRVIGSNFCHPLTPVKRLDQGKAHRWNFPGRVLGSKSADQCKLTLISRWLTTKSPCKVHANFPSDCKHYALSPKPTPSPPSFWHKEVAPYLTSFCCYAARGTAASWLQDRSSYDSAARYIVRYCTVLQNWQINCWQ